MKTLKKLFIFIAIIFSFSIFSDLIINAQTTTHARPVFDNTIVIDDGGGGSGGGSGGSSSDSSSNSYNYSCRSFLGLTSWDCHLGPNAWNSEANMTISVWVIASNISNDLVVIAAYLVLGYVIYGGYQYMFAAGEVGKTATGKKTLLHAFIGLAVVMSAKIIVSTLHIVLIGKAGSGTFSENCIDASCVDNPAELVNGLIQWVIGIAGIVAVIFLVLGGITYITSSGDLPKLQKAKNTILYALIGLAIVGLAEIITAFVGNAIRSSVTTSYNSTIIAKELSHEN